MPGFTKYCTYQSIIQICELFKFIEKKGKHVISQIHRQSVVSISLSEFTGKIKVITQKMLLIFGSLIDVVKQIFQYADKKWKASRL